MPTFVFTRRPAGLHRNERRLVLISVEQPDINKRASRCGAPQASYDRRRHGNNFHFQNPESESICKANAQAFPINASISKKKKTSLEVRGELMQSHQHRSSPVSIYMYKWEDRSTCLASRISTQKEPFPRSEFTPGSIWTYWMLIDRQMQSDFMSKLHRWISKLTARHLQILHLEIFWSTC